jgi:hypothetical protein
MSDHDDRKNHGDRDEEKDTSAWQYMGPAIRSALALTPLSPQAQEAGMTVINDVAQVIAQRRHDTRVEAAQREQFRLYKVEQERAEAHRREAAEAEARLAAAEEVLQLRQDLVDALSRVVSAEAALEAMAPNHWAATQLREAALQQERHIQATVDLAEGLGASRADIERALRQHIAQRSVHTSQLALDLLLSPLGSAAEESEPKVTKGKKGKRSGVA